MSHSLSEPSSYTPAQQRTVDLLGRGAGDDLDLDPDLGPRLEAMLTEALEPIAAALPQGETLWISKRALAQVHGCEAQYLAEDDAPFEWRIPMAVGKVVHKAVELSITYTGDPTPLDLVDEAFASLEAESSSFGDWLQTLNEGEGAQLRALANARVAAFVETFPPLERRWAPVTESPVRVELFGGTVVLAGKVDLTLGRFRRGTARKVLIDLKTGAFSPMHAEDLRFYALLETIRLGTPPRLCASYYLDTARPHPEIVTQDILLGAAQRTIDGATRMVALRWHDHLPTKRTGPACLWCPLQETCEEGTHWLRERDDP